MATWEDVRRLVLALPQTVEKSPRDWRVKDKLLAWERPLRKADLVALGDAAPKGAILGAWVRDLDTKEAWLAARPDVFFTTPHFDGYPAVLVRLAAIGKQDLRELVTDAWLARAPKRLAEAFRATKSPPATSSKLSPRLRAAVDALPLRAGLRVLEIGCGPGAAAREVAIRVAPGGHVLAIDRSQLAIEQARSACAELIASGAMSVRCVAAEDLVLEAGEVPYDLAFAIRVGALDKRHPEAEARAKAAIAAMLRPGAPLYVGDGPSMQRTKLPRRDRRH
jgi:hypothetical protein